MSIDHQKNHFKRSRDEIEEGDISKDQDTTNQIIIKKRKLETSNDMENNHVLDQSNTSVEFQQKMYKSYIKSALDALDNNVSKKMLFENDLFIMIYIY